MRNNRVYKRNGLTDLTKFLLNKNDKTPFDYEKHINFTEDGYEKVNMLTEFIVYFNEFYAKSTQPPDSITVNDALHYSVFYRMVDMLFATYRASIQDYVVGFDTLKKFDLDLHQVDFSFDYSNSTRISHKVLVFESIVRMNMEYYSLIFDNITLFTSMTRASSYFDYEFWDKFSEHWTKCVKESNLYLLEQESIKLDARRKIQNDNSLFNSLDIDKIKPDYNHRYLGKWKTKGVPPINYINGMPR